jgi:hypothetical protein
MNYDQDEQEIEEVSQDFINFENELQINEILVAHMSENPKIKKWTYMNIAEFLSSDGLEKNIKSAQKLRDMILKDVNEIIFSDREFNLMLYDSKTHYEDGFPDRKTEDIYRNCAMCFQKEYSDPEFEQIYSLKMWFFALLLDRQDANPIYKKGSLELTYANRKTGEPKNRFQYMKWTHILD